MELMSGGVGCGPGEANFDPSLLSGGSDIGPVKYDLSLPTHWAEQGTLSPPKRGGSID